ncbi:MAG: hypothetical protein Q7S35_04480, partial [Candidatus Limnocylindrales bacterium]|nr:hypothetical protein [Candidatus Limnocylindrales bacterium]
MIAILPRRIGGLGLAIALASGLLAVPATAPEVRAATPDLTIVSAARYDVQPEQHRVRVSLDLVLTNHLKDTVTKRYYFDRAFLAVLPDTSGFKLSWEGKGTPEVHVSKKTTDYTLLRLDLGQRLFSGKSATYKLRFDLVDPGGEPTRDVRVGGSLVSFPVWAFATDGTPGSSVEVVFPPGFEVDVEVGDIPEPTTSADGQVIFQTEKLDTPLSFFAYLVGDRPGAYSERSVGALVHGEHVDLTIRAWPDDPPWSDRVGDLVARALPVLGNEIGLGWPRDGGLVVQEAASRSTGGYAGLFDPKEGLVEVAYYAEDFVVLHEAAHAWFNGALLADRWANEAFASYYGLQVAGELGVPAEGDELTPELIDAGSIPLNAWGPIGREMTDTEDYAYAATLLLAQDIADRAGPGVLQRVWADAAARVGAYQPPAGDGVAGSGSAGATVEPETVEGPPDWRGLLDLLEAHDTDRYDDLWRLWVVRDTDLEPLDARLAARSRYDEVVAAAGNWRLPKPVRDALRAWQFDTATELLADASAILDQRAAIDSAAASSGLTPPPTLQTAFELPDGFTTAAREATAELDAIERYDAAAATRPAEPDTLQTLGLWGTTPDAELSRGRDLFASGDLAASTDAAGGAELIWTTAEEVGRG